MLVIMTPIPACATCGTPLTGGFCPRCLLAAGISSEPGEVSTNVPDGSGLARLGDYELVEEIGRGGMGIVYRARQVSLDRVVAIKLLPFGGLAGKDAALRLRAEAVAAGSLRHPNIVAIHEVGLQDGQHFIAMDYVAGPSLARVLRDGPLPARRAAALVRHAALAVQHAHERGIIHRDLKPSNILLDLAEDQPRITDFGLAKNLRSDTQLTLTGQTLGSPNYIPPEQIHGSRFQEVPTPEPEHPSAECVKPAGPSGKISFASDVYALGAILYHAVTGRPPFIGDEIAAVLHQVIQDEPVAPRRLNPSVPTELETICLKCLQKESNRRYATAQELAEELARFLNDEPIQARPATRLDRAWRWCRKNPTVATLTAATILLLLTVAIGGPVAAFRINRQRRQAELRAYTADMNVVRQVWEEGNLGRAKALLRAHIPKSGQPDLRGLEWRFLWNLCQDQSLANLTNFNGAVRSLCFTPDGRSLLVGTGKLLKVLDGTTYREQTDIWDSKGSLSLLATCSALPNLLATAGAENSRIQLWELPTRRLLGIVVGSPINALALSPEGQLLAWACENGSLEVWDVMGKTNLWRHQLEHPSRALAFSHDGKTLVSGGSEHGGNALLWQARTGAELPGLPPAHGGWLGCVAFSPDDRTLATSGYDGTLILWDFSARRQLHTFMVYAQALAFSPDGHTLAVGGGDNLLRVWDLTDPEKPPLVWHGHRANITSLAFRPDGRALLSGDGDGALKVWPPGPKSDPSLLMKADHWITTIAIAPNGRYLAAADYHAHHAALFDLSSRRWITNFTGHSSGVQGVAFSLDGNWLATGSEDHTVRLWNLATLHLERILTNNFPSTLPAFSPDNRVLAVAGWIPTSVHATNTLAFWDVVSGTKLDRLSQAALSASAVTFSHHGRLVAVGHFDGSVEVWDWLQQTRLAAFKNPGSGPTWSLAFSADDELLATSSALHPVIYDLRKRQSFYLDGYGCGTVAFSQDNKSLICVGDDSLFFWNLATRAVALRFRCHTAPVSGLAIAPDETLLATSAADGTVRLWPTPSFDQIRSSEDLRSP